MSPLWGCSHFICYQWLAPLAKVCRPSGAIADNVGNKNERQ